MAGQGFVGKWKMDKSENFDQYMKAVGVGTVMAKLGSSAKPTVIITRDDSGQWNLRTETTFKSSDCHFKLGEEFDETTTDGRKCRTTFSLEGEKKLVQEQKGDVPSTIIRELTDDNTLTVTAKAKEVVATRVYVRA